MGRGNFFLKAGNVQCCIEATQVDGECEHKLLSRGKSNPNLGMAAKGATWEAAGQSGSKQSWCKSAVPHTETSNLKHLSEINSLE